MIHFKKEHNSESKALLNKEGVREILYGYSSFFKTDHNKYYVKLKDGYYFEEYPIHLKGARRTITQQELSSGIAQFFYKPKGAFKEFCFCTLKEAMQCKIKNINDLHPLEKEIVSNEINENLKMSRTMELSIFSYHLNVPHFIISAVSLDRTRSMWTASFKDLDELNVIFQTQIRINKKKRNNIVELSNSIHTEEWLTPLKKFNINVVDDEQNYYLNVSYEDIIKEIAEHLI